MNNTIDISMALSETIFIIFVFYSICGRKTKNRCKIIRNCIDYLTDLSNPLILIGTFGPLFQRTKLALYPVKHAFALRIQKKAIYLKCQSKYIVFLLHHLIVDGFFSM